MSASEWTPPNQGRYLDTEYGVPKMPEPWDPGWCPQCWGCGEVANSKDQEAWILWANLPVKSAAAVTLGLVTPIECPECGGTGLRGGGRIREEGER